MKKTLALVASLLLLASCSPAPSSPEGRQNLHGSAQDTLETFRRIDPGMRAFLNNKAYGYAVIPGVGKGGFIVGGAYGTGEVYERGTMIGWCDISQATIGAQIGGQSYEELIVFEDKNALDRFKRNELAFSAQASAVILKSGASTDAKFTDGVAVFTHPMAGAMAEASVGGQQFTFKAKPAPDSMNK